MVVRFGRMRRETLDEHSIDRGVLHPTEMAIDRFRVQRTEDAGGASIGKDERSR